MPASSESPSDRRHRREADQRDCRRGRSREQGGRSDAQHPSAPADRQPRDRSRGRGARGGGNRRWGGGPGLTPCPYCERPIRDLERSMQQHQASEYCLVRQYHSKGWSWEDSLWHGAYKAKLHSLGRTTSPVCSPPRSYYSAGAGSDEQGVRRSRSRGRERNNSPRRERSRSREERRPDLSLRSRTPSERARQSARAQREHARQTRPVTPERGPSHRPQPDEPGADSRRRDERHAAQRHKAPEDAPAGSAVRHDTQQKKSHGTRRQKDSAAPKEQKENTVRPKAKEEVGERHGKKEKKDKRREAVARKRSPQGGAVEHSRKKDVVGKAERPTGPAPAQRTAGAAADKQEEEYDNEYTYTYESYTTSQTSESSDEPPELAAPLAREKAGATPASHAPAQAAAETARPPDKPVAAEKVRATPASRAPAQAAAKTARRPPVAATCPDGPASSTPGVQKPPPETETPPCPVGAQEAQHKKRVHMCTEFLRTAIETAMAKEDF